MPKSGAKRSKHLISTFVYYDLNPKNRQFKSSASGKISQKKVKRLETINISWITGVDCIILCKDTGAKVKEEYHICGIGWKPVCCFLVAIVQIINCIL